MMAAPLILVVDDDADIREVVQATLETEGYRVVTAGSALDALAVLGRMWPDAIVLDQRMHPVDGIAMLEQVKAQWGRVPPTVLATAYLSVGQTEGVTAAGRALGLKKVLTKPFEMTTLLSAVAATLALDPPA